MKNCAHCNGRTVIERDCIDASTSKFRAICSNCGIRTEWCDGMDAAGQLWETRFQAVDDAKVQLNQAIQQRNEAITSASNWREKFHNLERAVNRRVAEARTGVKFDLSPASDVNMQTPAWLQEVKGGKFPHDAGKTVACDMAAPNSDKGQAGWVINPRWVDGLQADLEAARQEIQALEVRISEMRAMRDDIRTTRDNLFKEKRRAEDALGNMREENAKLHRVLETARNTIQNREVKISELNLTLREKARNLEGVNRQLASLERRHVEHVQRNEVLSRELAEAKDGWAASQGARADLQRELNDLRERVRRQVADAGPG